MTERVIRRRCEEQGVLLRKSRSRDRNDPSFGRYMLVDQRANTVILGGSPFAFSADLEHVCEWLAST